MLRRSFAVALLTLSAIGASAVTTPKSQCEDLLNVVLPQAEKLLAAHAEFFPFGASMKPDGQIALAAAYDGRERPPSQPIIDLLHDGFHRDAIAGSIIASATVYDVRVVPPGETSKTDAIEIELDHRDNYSTIVFFPYAIRDGKVELKEAFAIKGAFRIFAKNGS